MKQIQTKAADRCLDEIRASVEAIEDEAFDLAIDAVAEADRYDVGETEMVGSAYGEYVRVDEAQAAIGKLQR